MIAFWAIVSLVGYGIFHAGGLVSQFDRWMGTANQVLIDPFPLVGKLKYSTLLAAGVLALVCWGTSRFIHQRPINNLLTDTEAEMQKVTWPTWAEVTQGTFAVTVMVAILFVFLTGVDLLLIQVIRMLMPGSAT